MNHLKSTVLLILLHSFLFISPLSGLPRKKLKLKAPVADLSEQMSTAQIAIANLTKAKDTLHEAMKAVIDYKTANPESVESNILSELQKEEQKCEVELQRVVAEAETEFQYCHRHNLPKKDLSILIKECRGLLRTSPYGKETLETASAQRQKAFQRLSIRATTRHNGTMPSEGSPELLRRRDTYLEAVRAHVATASFFQSKASDEEPVYAKTPAHVGPPKSNSSHELVPPRDPAYGSVPEKVALFQSFSMPTLPDNSSTLENE